MAHVCVCLGAPFPEPRSSICSEQRRGWWPSSTSGPALTPLSVTLHTSAQLPSHLASRSFRNGSRLGLTLVVPFLNRIHTSVLNRRHCASSGPYVFWCLWLLLPRSLAPAFVTRIPACTPTPHPGGGGWNSHSDTHRVWVPWRGAQRDMMLLRAHEVGPLRDAG